MTDWYQRSINALQLNGKGERTQEAYTRAVRMLSTFYSKPPDEITEPELEAYFLRRRTRSCARNSSPCSMRYALRYARRASRLRAYHSR